MSRFLDNAAEIFDAAQRSMEAGLTPSEVTILVTATGQVSMVADCDWPLEALERERGARMVYRISRQDNTVRLEGREGSRTCLLEAQTPNGVSRRLLAGPAMETTPPASAWWLRGSALPVQFA